MSEAGGRWGQAVWGLVDLGSYQIYVECKGAIKSLKPGILQMGLAHICLLIKPSLAPREEVGLLQWR